MKEKIQHKQISFTEEPIKGTIKLSDILKSFQPFLFIACGFVFFYFFGWIGLCLGFPVAFFLKMTISSIIGVRYWNNCAVMYEHLIAEDCTKDEALLKISKITHPELSINTHMAIINRFDNIDFLVNFFTGGIGLNKVDNEFALDILEHTSIEYLGPGRYKVVTKYKQNNSIRKGAKINQTELDNMHISLKHRKYWQELNGDVLENLYQIFEGDFTSFKDFVDISEHYNLLKENYLELAKEFKEPKELIPYFALTLERSGAKLIESFSKNNNENYKIDAKKCYEVSIKLNPFLIFSYGALAIVYDSEGDTDKATEYYDKGIKAFENLQNIPKEELSYYNQALVSNDSALQLLKGIEKDFIKKDKKNIFVSQNNSKEENKTQSLNLNKALELNPNDTETWNNKGMALDEIGKYEEAIKCYDKAIELDPNDIAAWNNKGMALENLGKYEEAVKCYDKDIGIESK